jgi:hypothetical protein
LIGIGFGPFFLLGPLLPLVFARVFDSNYLGISSKCNLSKVKTEFVKGWIEMSFRRNRFERKGELD